MNILITGYAGFIGNSLVGKLKNKENTIVGIGREMNLKNELKFTPDISIKGDIRDYDLMRRIIVDYEIDEIYHCAAQAIVGMCSNDPHSTFDINVMGTVNLLEACRNTENNVKSIVVSTSDKAFGHGPLPYTEESVLKPLYTYETSKACQQMITLCYFNNFNVPCKVIACSNVYGPGDFNKSRIIPNTITRLAKNQPALLNNGVVNYVRELVYIGDVVDAFIVVSRKGKPGELYCCGGTQHIPIGELINKICMMMDKDSSQNIELFERPSHLKEIEKQYIDSTKLRSIGWEPKVSLEEGLKKTIEYYTNLIKEN